MVLLFAAALALGRDVLHAEKPVASWHSGTAWTDGKIPDKDDRAIAPGSKGAITEIRINESRNAAVSSLLIGKPSRSKGTLEVLGHLRVAGTNGGGETHGGHFIIGGTDNKNAIVRQRSGSSIFASRLIRIADFTRSTGRLSVRKSTVTTPGAILLGRGKDSIGVFECVGGQSSIQAGALQMGPGDARLVFTTDKAGISPLHVSGTTSLSGTLIVRIPDWAGTPRVLPILRLGENAKRVGGFRSVQVEAPTNKHYELSYTSGGRGRDVVLTRLDKPLIRFEKWQAAMLADAPSKGSARPRSDADGDGLSNLGEYKLGRNPLVDEGELFLKGVEENGDPFIRFSDRRDRKDVRTIVQVSHDGRVWTSAGINTQVVERFGNSRTVKAVAKGQNSRLKFRLFFELVPDKDVPPNILFITIDDLNDFVEPLGGHPQAVTPNFNALAARGTLFANAHSNSTVCNPSRTSLLTGIRPTTSGIYKNSAEMRNSPVLENVNTMPEQFRSNGYRVVGAGKIFHNAEPQAWSEYFPSKTNHVPEDPSPESPLNPIRGLRENFDFGALSVTDDKMGDHKVASWICQWMKSRQSKDGPAFIGCGFFRPHLPLHVPSKHFNAWRTTDLEVPLVLNNDLNDVPVESYTDSTMAQEHAAIREAGRWKKLIHAYLAAVRFSDAQLGRVIAALDDSELARNTIIVLCSDHGFHLGEKQTWRKSSLWEESTRVPLVIVAPGVTTPGTRCEEVVSLLDVFPTLTDLAGVKTPSRLEGTSLLPQLIDPLRERDIPAVTSRSVSGHSIRTKQYRYTNRNARNADELYDHTIDPNEWVNVIDDPAYADVVRRLQKYVPSRIAPSID